MGGLNASYIAQGVKPPQIDDPITTAEGISRLEQLRRQAALAPLQAQDLQNRVQLGQQDVQSGQEDQADNATWKKAFSDSGGDYDKARAIAGPQMNIRNLQKIDANHLNIQRGVLDLATATDKAKRDNWSDIKSQNELISQALDAVMKAPDAKKSDMYTAGRAQLQKRGIDTSMLPETLPDDDTLMSYAAMAGYTGKMIRDAERQAQTERAKSAAARADQQAKNLDAKERAEEMSRKMNDAATDHVAVLDQGQHDAWLASLDPDIQPRFANLKKFTPETQKAVQGMALTAAQRAADANKQTALDENQRRLDAIQQRADANDRRVDAVVGALSTGGPKNRQQKTVQAIANRIIDEQGGSLQNAYSTALKSQDDDDLTANRGMVVKYLGDLVRQSNLNTPKPTKPSWRDRLNGGATSPQGTSAAAPSGSQPKPKYAEGDVVQNSKGDKLVLRGGQWVPLPR